MTDNAVKPAPGELAKAMALNQIKEVEDLLRRGADFNEEDAHLGWNVLTSAANFGRIEIVRLLIAAGADVNRKSRYGVTPLMRASITGHIEIAELLIDKGADVGARDDNGHTAQFYAESKNLLQVAWMLKEAPQMLRRRAAAVEAHALAIKRQQLLKARAPKVVITGGPQP